MHITIEPIIRVIMPRIEDMATVTYFLKLFNDKGGHEIISFSQLFPHQNAEAIDRVTRREITQQVIDLRAALLLANPELTFKVKPLMFDNVTFNTRDGHSSKIKYYELEDI